MTETPPDRAISAPTPIVVISFDDRFAASLVESLNGVCHAMHISPLMKTVQSSLDALAPSLILFDLQAMKTEDQSILSIMEDIEQSHPAIRKVAIGYATATMQVISAMKAGACDFLDRDADPAEMRETIEQQLRHVRSRAGRREGRVIAVSSALRNEGAVQLCVNLAAHLAASGEDTLLLDYDLGRSFFEIEFDREVTYSVGDGIEELLRLDRTVLDGVLPTHKSGLQFLPMAGGAWQDKVITPQDLAMLLSALRTIFGTVIVNAACLRHAETQPYLAPLFEHLLLCGTQKISSAMALQDMLSNDCQHLSNTSVGLVITDYDDRVRLRPEAVAERVGLPLQARLPSARVALTNSHNAGEPLILTAPHAPYSRAVKRVAKHLAAHPDDNVSRLKAVMNLLRAPRRGKREAA